MAEPSARDSNFLPSRLAFRQRSPVLRYGFGVLAFAIALILRWQLDAALPTGLPFLTFFPAVILTTFGFGLGPGILVGVLSTVASWYWFLPPTQSFALTSASTLALAFFIAIVAIHIATIHVMQNALARLRTERARSAKLAEHRELLFTELQHRIANNLQVVSALMQLQKSTLSDAQARQALNEASHRLALVAKLNQKLHDPTNAGLDLKAFLRELCQDVSEAAGIADPGCHVKGPDGVALPVDKAVPLALIVTELLNNSIEHGFAGRASGDLRLALERAGDEAIVLTVQDNGHGLPAGFDLRQAKSLGLRIVQSLANQIDAQLEMFSDGGTTCRLTFVP